MHSLSADAQRAGDALPGPPLPPGSLYMEQLELLHEVAQRRHPGEAYLGIGIPACREQPVMIVHHAVNVR